MAASIRSTLYQTPGGSVVGPILTDTSRDDLRTGYQVKCESVYDANTYAWTLAYTPDSAGPAAGSGNDYTGTPSTAALLPPEGSASKTCKFNVDWNGSYLIRLVTDAGLPTESTMFIRFRALTLFGELKLTAAGERRDQTGVVPVDASAKGWAEDANQNMLRLLAFVRRTAVSGRVLYVDANRGRDNSADQNDPDNVIRFPGPDSTNRDATGIRSAAVGFADFSSINDAIAYAQAAVSRGEPVLSADNPYIINIAPGLYEENLNVPANIFLVGHPGFSGILPTVYTGGLNLNPEVVRIRTVSNGIHAIHGSLTGPTFLKNLILESYSSSGSLPYTVAVYGGAVFMESVNMANWVPGGRGLINDPTLQCIIDLQGCSITAEAEAWTMLNQLPVARNLFVASQSTFMADSNVLRPEGRNINTSLQHCWVASTGSGDALNGFPGAFRAVYTTFDGNVTITAAPIVNYNANLALNYCTFSDDLTLNGGATSGQIDIGGAATTVKGDLIVSGVNVNQNWKDVLSGEGSTSILVTNASGSPYSVPDSIVMVRVTPPGTSTVQLPATPVNGRYIIIKDVSGNAAMNPITIIPQGADSIQGAPNYTINSNWGAIQIVYSLPGATWHII